MYQVCALGRLSVLASIWCIVNSLGPTAPVEPESKSGQSLETQSHTMCLAVGVSIK